ncbi:MAG: GNAT family N-acetyltransferase [Clostridia bacterium]
MICSIEKNDIIQINELNIKNNFCVKYDYESGFKYVVNNSIVGYITYKLNYDTVDIISVLTDIDYRKNNIATKLILELIKNFNNKIFLEVNENNLNAIKLYEKLNFKKINVRKKYYNNKFDAYIYCYNIK